MKILITGYTGFIGKAVTIHLGLKGHQLIGWSRQQHAKFNYLQKSFTGDIGPQTDFKSALSGLDAVIHLAARVHVMNEKARNPLVEFRKVNVHGTINLARQAADYRVKRFIYLSSIKVNGEQTPLGRAFSENDVPNPLGPYAISKFEAEQELLKIANDSSMEMVIIRPPIVFGPGVKANFRSMMKWLYKGAPLPLGIIKNKRSLVGLGNLVDFIATCLEHPAAANEIFLVSDGEDISTSELLRRTARALGVPVRLLPIPPMLLKATAKLAGKNDMAQRLLGNLQVDISKAKKVLGWSPSFSIDQELEKTARWFLKKKYNVG